MTKSGLFRASLYRNFPARPILHQLRRRFHSAGAFGVRIVRLSQSRAAKFWASTDRSNDGQHARRRKFLLDRAIVTATRECNFRQRHATSQTFRQPDTVTRVATMDRRSAVRRRRLVEVESVAVRAIHRGRKIRPLLFRRARRKIKARQAPYSMRCLKACMPRCRWILGDSTVSRKVLTNGRQ